MSGDGDGGTLRDVASNFLCTLLDDEATETPQIYGLVLDQRTFYVLHESLNNLLNENLLCASLFGDVVYDVCL